MSAPLTVFIPSAAVAICADCRGHFYAPGRIACPGCGSSAWVLAEREELARAEFDAADREPLIEPEV